MELIDDLDRVILIELILADLSKMDILALRRSRLRPLLEKLQGVDARLFVAKHDA